jgi:hypothetical protein
MNLLLALLTALSAASPAHAVDTSGCSQLVETTARATTTSGNLLTATYAHAPRANCWNANQASVTIAYRFLAVEPNPAVSFWVKLNGRDQTLIARVTCSSDSSGVAKDTSNARRFACFALASIPTGLGSQTLEVAPAVNGNYDTSGYGENSRFSL